jgi:hypothetical protein
VLTEGTVPPPRPAWHKSNHACFGGNQPDPAGVARPDIIQTYWQ